MEEEGRQAGRGDYMGCIYIEVREIVSPTIKAHRFVRHCRRSTLFLVAAPKAMFVYVWVGLGFFLSLLTSSYDAMNMFFHVLQGIGICYWSYWNSC